MTMLREGKNPDGTTGPVSIRRVLALAFAVASVALFAAAFIYSEHGWIVFIPGISCLAAVLILLFFTTWSDVSAVLSSVKGVF